MTPYIIGEAGSCHGGRLAVALSLVRVAEYAGCSAVKFQYWSCPRRMRERRHVQDPAAYGQGSIERAWLPFLAHEARERSLHFLCTVYLPEDVPALDRFVDAWKISSFEREDAELLAALPQNDDRPVYISCGMSETSPDWQVPFPLLRRVSYLHCVSGYPVPPGQAHLGPLRSGLYAGYSDHTRSIHTGGLAIAAGARVLEVHFCLADTPPTCPDACVSLTPRLLTRYVHNARDAWVISHESRRVLQPCEAANVPFTVR